MTHILLTVIGFFLTELKSLDLLYHFQVKEYRLDRYATMVKEKGPEVLFTIGRLPARSMRNIMAAVIITAILAAWSVITYTNDRLLLATALMYWAIAFLATMAGIFLTWLPSLIRKNMLFMAASARIKNSRVTVIGITGSYGKTTTKEYLFDILSRKFPVAKTLHNMNTTAGVALSVLGQLHPDTKYFIAEMGAYKTGEIAEICRMVNPSYGILTAIGNQHLDLFGSREKLVQAKKELLTSLPAGGKAYVNQTRAPLEQLKSGIRAAVVPYRSNEKSVNLNGYNLPPEVIRENLVPCILLARELGLAENEIRDGIRIIKSKRQRLTPMTGIKRCTIIDNSYNTNGEGFIFSIELLHGRKEKTRILTTPGIIELGEEKRPTYERILHVLAKTGVTLYTTDADFKKSSLKNVRIFESEKAMQSAILTELGPQTVILFEGRQNRGFINSLLKK